MKKLLGMFSLFAATMTYASNESSVNLTEVRSSASMEDIAYVNMTTAQLQEAVERRSLNGDLSFDMGLELIRRWTNS